MTQKPIIGFLKDINDVDILIHAFRLGYYSPAKTRLNKTETQNIKVNEIYCFIEDTNSRMKRWTDSFQWSGSRVKGDFLVYDLVRYEDTYLLGKENVSPSVATKNIPENLNYGLIDIQSKYDQNSCNYDRHTIISIRQLNRNVSIKKRTISKVYNGIKYHFINYYENTPNDEERIVNKYLYNTLLKIILKNPCLKDDNYVRNTPNIKKFIDNERKKLENNVGPFGIKLATLTEREELFLSRYKNDFSKKEFNAISTLYIHVKTNKQRKKQRKHKQEH